MECLNYIYIFLQNDNLYLVSIKQSHIIVFQMNLDHHGNVCIHSYSIAPSIHDVPITALHCKGNSILTSDEDGVTQHWQLGMVMHTQFCLCDKSQGVPIFY